MVETVVIEETRLSSEDYEQAVEVGRSHIRDHIAQCAGQRPLKVTVALDRASDEWVCTLDVPKSNIARYARITGYLSDTRNWHKAKAAELKDRVKHMKMGGV